MQGRGAEGCGSARGVRGRGDRWDCVYTGRMGLGGAAAASGCGADSRQPEGLCGYSDHTSLHVWLAREAGLVTFYGPMWLRTLRGRREWTRRAGACVSGDTQWSLGAEDGLRVLRAAWLRGRLRVDVFRLRGGLGTPYAALAANARAANSVSRGHWDKALSVGPDCCCICATRG